MTEMRIRKPKYPQPEPEPENPKKKLKKSHNTSIKELAIVHEFAKDPMSKVKTRVLEIGERWYFDMRVFKVYIDRETQEEKETYGKGICLPFDFISDIKDALVALERYSKDSLE